MSLLLRSTVRAARQIPSATARRNVHFENVVGKTLPFNVEHKVGMAIKVSTYFVVGFGLPFGAAAWHLKKGAGAAA